MSFRAQDSIKCKKLYTGLDRRILTCYNNALYPGIAKLVSRLVWDQETVRSSRTTRTKISLKSTISEEFFLFFVYCGAEFKNGPLIYFVVPLYQLYLLIRKPTDFSVVILQKIDIIFMEVFEAHSCLTHCSGERV